MALEHEQMTARVATVRAAVELLGTSEHSGPLVAGDHELEAGSSDNGCVDLIATIDSVTAMTGSARHFGMAAIITYGAWLFPGLLQEQPKPIWDFFEADILGMIKKDKRKSKVVYCALHPLEITNKYYNDAAMSWKTVNAAQLPKPAGP